MNRQDFDHSKIEGIDASIDISLQEYGFAWIKGEAETLFYYGIEGNEEDYTRFDFCTFPNDMRPREEFDFVAWGEVAETCGLSNKEFMSQPLPLLLFDLVHYYGYENVFGSSYYEGLTYEEIIKD